MIIIDKKEISKLLRKYNSEEVLKLIANETRGMVLEHKPLENLEMEYIQNGIRKKQTIQVAAWMYTDLAYEIILNSNDYRGKKPSFSELVYLLGKVNEFKDLEVNEAMSKYTGMELGTFVLFGHAQKQFWYQMNALMIEQYFRNIDIFIRTPKTLEGKINFDEVIKIETGYSIEQYTQALIYIWGIGIKQSNFNDIKFLDFRAENIDEKCINDILKKYIVPYQEIKEDKNKLGASILLIKPIIRTQKNNLIVSNCYLLFKLISDGLYWTIRNHFFNKIENSERQQFVNYFGEIFEVYVGEILKKNIKKDVYERLENNQNGKIADWIIRTDKYFIIVEQKSSLMAIKTKSFTPDINALNEFINRNYNSKGIPQLDATEEKYKEEIRERKVIKIILYYETIFIMEMVKILLLQMRNETAEERNNLFFVSISEFERFITVLKKDENIFNTIIEEKLALEKLPLKDGTDISKLLEKYNMNENEYIDIVEKDFFDKLLGTIKKYSKAGE